MSRGFAAWAVAAALSLLGDAIAFFALTWVAAGHGAVAAGLVLTAGSIPLCALVLVGGTLADRWGIRPMLVGCDLVMALVMGAFAVGALTAVPVPMLVAIAFASGTASALRRPAAMVFPRMFARGDELTRLMAGVTLLNQLAQVTGPAFGGLLLAAGGLALTSAVDAVTFLIVGLVVIVVRPPLLTVHDASESSASSGGLREGIVAARRSPGVPSTLLAVCGVAITILPLVELCVPLLGHDRGWGVGGTALVAAAWPIGGMAVMASVTRRGPPSGRAACGGPVVAAGGALLLAAASQPTTGIVAVLLVGVGTSMTTARLIPRFLDATPAALLARFASLLQLAQIAPVLVATPALGWAAHRVGVPGALVGMAAVLMLTAIAVARADKDTPTVTPVADGMPERTVGGAA